MYSGHFKIAEVRDRFWSYCGTSHILRYDLLPVDVEPYADISFESIVNSLDRFYVQHILGCHLDYSSYVAKRGPELEPLPFHGAVWHTDTGENASRLWWGYRRFGTIWGKHLTSEQRHEFGIPAMPRRIQDTALLYVWRARSVLAQSVRRILRS